MMSNFNDRYTYSTVQSIPSVNSLSIITGIFLLSTQTNTSSVLVRDLVNDTQIPVYLTDDEGFDWPCKSVTWLNWEGIDVADICSDECGSDVCVPTNTTHLACYNPNDSTKSYQEIYVEPTPSEETDSEKTVFLVVIHKLQLLWHVDYLDSDSARYYQLKTRLTGIMTDMLVSYRSTVTSHIFSPGSVIAALGIATPVSMLDDLIETLMVFTGNDLLVIDSVFTNIILSLNTTGCSVVGSVCLQCQEGTCGSCETPHYATPSGQCRECTAYGQACSACKIDSCVTCEGPYYVSLTGTCEECTDYGEECSQCDVDTCLRCADGYYAASNGACRENPLRCRDYMQYCIHGSCFDDHEGIHCQCPTHFDGEQCQDPVTIIDSLSPAIGVQAGGTRITIKGHHLNINDIPEIHTRSNRLICNESAGTGSEFTCLTIPGEASAVGRADQLTLYWAATDVELHLDRGQTFTYKENPVVENIHPLHVTPEGGIELTIVGENLEAVGDPTLLTNLVIRAEDINDNYTTACQLDADDILKCPSAKLEIPPEVSLVDSCVNDNSGILCDVDLHIGLQLDGFDAYQNIEEALPEQGRLVAHVPPSVDYNEKEILYQTWWPKKPEQIEIHGKNLKIFEASFEIWVGKSQSDLLKKDVYDNVMFFSPTKDKSAYQHGSSSTYDIQVTLGNKNYTAGHINFEFSIWDCGDCQLGLCFGIAGVVLIALIVMCIKKEKFKKCLRIGHLNNEDSTKTEPEEPKYLDMMRTQFTHITSTFNRMSVTGAPRNQHVRQARQARHNYGETSKDAYERREKRRNNKRHKTKANGGSNPLHSIPYSESIEMSSVNVQRRVKRHYYKDQENPDVYNKNLRKNPKRKFPGNHQRYPNQLPTQHDQYRVDIEWDEAGNRESFTDDDYAADWYHDNNNGDRSDPWVTTPYQHPRRLQQDPRERNRMYKY